MLHRIGWGQVAAAFARVGGPLAVALVALGLLEALFDTAALRVALGRRIGLARLLGYQSAGALLNAVVPLEAGEVLKGTLITRHVSPGDAITGLIVWNYIYKLSRPLFTLGAVLVAAALAGTVEPRTKWLVLGATLVSFVPYLVLRLAVRTGIAVALVRLAHLLHIRSREPGRWHEHAQRLDDAVRVFWHQRPGDFLAVLALQAASRAGSLIATLVVLWALRVPLATPASALLYGAQSGAEYLLLFLPARVGVAEGAAFFVFGLFGVAPALGVLTSLVIRLRGLTANGLGALLVVLTGAPRSGR